VSADPADEPAAEDEGFAFLTPGGAPGSLGLLDHYEVLEVIGRGGMGIVFKARDTRLQRIVAVKVLAAHLAADGTARQTQQKIATPAQQTAPPKPARS